MLHLQSSRAPRRRLGVLARGTGVFAIGVLVGLGCSTSDDPSSISNADAGPSCEPGTAGCECTSSGGCRDELLCTVGRCLRTENSGSPDDPEPGRPLPSRPDPVPAIPPDPPSDASTSVPPDGAAPTDAAPPDATIPTEPDTGSPPPVEAGPEDAG